jgi:hypothetical protein
MLNRSSNNKRLKRAQEKKGETMENFNREFNKGFVGRKKVTVNLDEDLIEWLASMSADSGFNRSQLINFALRESKGVVEDFMNKAKRGFGGGHALHRALERGFERAREKDRREAGAVLTVEAKQAQPMTLTQALSLFPAELRNLLIFSKQNGKIVIKPRHILSPDNFSQVTGIVKSAGGLYVSAGRNSHFEIA